MINPNLSSSNEATFYEQKVAQLKEENQMLKERLREREACNQSHSYSHHSRSQRSHHSHSQRNHETFQNEFVKSQNELNLKKQPESYTFYQHAQNGMQTAREMPTQRHEFQQVNNFYTNQTIPMRAPTEFIDNYNDKRPTKSLKSGSRRAYYSENGKRLEMSMREDEIIEIQKKSYNLEREAKKLTRFIKDDIRGFLKDSNIHNECSYKIKYLKSLTSRPRHFRLGV